MLYFQALADGLVAFVGAHAVGIVVAMSAFVAVVLVVGGHEFDAVVVDDGAVVVVDDVAVVGVVGVDVVGVVVVVVVAVVVDIVVVDGDDIVVVDDVVVVDHVVVGDVVVVDHVVVDHVVEFHPMWVENAFEIDCFQTTRAEFVVVCVASNHVQQFVRCLLCPRC